MMALCRTGIPAGVTPAAVRYGHGCNLQQVVLNFRRVRRAPRELSSRPRPHIDPKALSPILFTTLFKFVPLYYDTTRFLIVTYLPVYFSFTRFLALTHWLSIANDCISLLVRHFPSFKYKYKYHNYSGNFGECFKFLTTRTLVSSFN